MSEGHHIIPEIQRMTAETALKWMQIVHGNWKSPSKGERLQSSIERLFFQLPFEQGLVCAVTAFEIHEPGFQAYARRDAPQYAGLLQDIIDTVYCWLNHEPAPHSLVTLDERLEELNSAVPISNPLSSFVFSSHILLVALQQYPETMRDALPTAVLMMYLADHTSEKVIGPRMDYWWETCKKRLPINGVKTARINSYNSRKEQTVDTFLSQ